MDNDKKPNNPADDGQSTGFAGNRAGNARRGRKPVDGAAPPNADRQGAGQRPAPLPSGERQDGGLEAGEAGTAPQGRLGNTAESTSPQERRIERFRHLHAGQRLITWRGQKDGLQYPMDWHRTGTCHWKLLGSVATINWMGGGRAVWSGITICGKVWACPICAPKIQEQRRWEIDQAMDWAYRNDLKVVMVTLTVPHKRWHKVADLLKQQQEALTRLRSGKRAKAFRERIGHRGLIRALELTHGENGWHPHTHELWFVEDDQPADPQAAENWGKEFRTEVLSMWERACVAAGLLDPAKESQVKTFRRRSVDVMDRASRGAYLAKLADAMPDGADRQKAKAESHWGADREMASASTKQGRAEGRTPPQILAGASDSPTNVDRRRDGAIWLDEIDALRGRPWLFWSKGLKKECGLDETTDEDVAESETESEEQEPIPVVCFDKKAWKAVRDHQAARALVLDIVEFGMENGIEPATIAEEIGERLCDWGCEIEGRIWAPGMNPYGNHGKLSEADHGIPGLPPSGDGH
jgi:hypothetical protein